MSSALLGEPFDIHGGGMDLQFPHHENEIAQSEGASGGPFVNVWLHNGFLNIDDEKMSKSLGNFFTIRDVLRHVDGETVRLFMLRTHYRSPFNFSDALLDEARQALRRLYTALDAVEAAEVAIDWARGPAKRLRLAMNDDFNTPAALAVLFELAGECNRTRDPAAAGLLRALGGFLGLLQQSPRAWLQGGVDRALDEAAIRRLIEARAQAKHARDFAEADRIRAELAAQGVVLQDGAGGTSWVRA
jgi:cysteinyl-tRNA synthetase